MPCVGRQLNRADCFGLDRQALSVSRAVTLFRRQRPAPHASVSVDVQRTRVFHRKPTIRREY